MGSASDLNPAPFSDTFAKTLRRSLFVGPHAQITPKTHQQYKKRITRLMDATNELVDLLNLVGRLPEGLLPEALSCADYPLDGLKDWLDQLNRKPAGGRRPHFGRELCADLIVHWWKLCHDKAEPRSDKVYLACEEYWRACGGEPSGDIENWRRMVKEAASRPKPLLMHNMLILMLGGTEPATK
jgi:hypothetical protein